MLWKLFSSKERVAKALQETTVSYDLSPPAIVELPEVDEEKPFIPANKNSRLWIEDWSEKDENRLRDPDVTFGISWSNRKRS